MASDAESEGLLPPAQQVSERPPEQSTNPVRYDPPDSPDTVLTPLSPSPPPPAVPADLSHSGGAGVVDLDGLVDNALVSAATALGHTLAD